MCDNAYLMALDPAAQRGDDCISPTVLYTIPYNVGQQQVRKAREGEGMKKHSPTMNHNKMSQFTNLK